MAKANHIAKFNVKRQEVHSAILQEELQSYIANGWDIRQGKEMALVFSEDR